MIDGQLLSGVDLAAVLTWFGRQNRLSIRILMACSSARREPNHGTIDADALHCSFPQGCPAKQSTTSIHAPSKIVFWGTRPRHIRGFEKKFGGLSGVSWGYQSTFGGGPKPQDRAPGLANPYVHHVTTYLLLSEQRIQVESPTAAKEDQTLQRKSSPIPSIPFTWRTSHSWQNTDLRVKSGFSEAVIQDNEDQNKDGDHDEHGWERHGTARCADRYFAIMTDETIQATLKSRLCGELTQIPFST